MKKLQADICPVFYLFNWKKFEKKIFYFMKVNKLIDKAKKKTVKSQK